MTGRVPRGHRAAGIVVAVAVAACSVPALQAIEAGTDAGVDASTADGSTADGSPSTQDGAAVGDGAAEAGLVRQCGNADFGPGGIDDAGNMIGDVPLVSFDTVEGIVAVAADGRILHWTQGTTENWSSWTPETLTISIPSVDAATGYTTLPLTDAGLISPWSGAFSYDGNLILVSSDDTKLWTVTVDGGAIDTIDDSPFTLIDTWGRAPGESIGSPVMTPNGLTLYYTLTPDGGASTIYSSTRSTTKDEFPVPDAAVPGLGQYGQVTGIADDGLTLFLMIPWDWEVWILTRDSADDPWSAATRTTVLAQGGGYWAPHPTDGCKSVVAECCIGGAQWARICKLPLRDD
jgi:hypothetical protein